MKNLRKVFTLVLVLALALSLAAPAMAAEVPVGNITISAGSSDAAYAFYRLLNATDGGNGKYAYTLNDKYEDILKAQTGKTELEDIVKYISDLSADGLRTFADAVYAAIKAGSIAEDATATGNTTLQDIRQGYYLIAETKIGSDYNGATDTRSLVMLDTVGDASVTVTTKESVPTVDKEVWNYNDSTGENHWGEHADYDVGDSVKFRISGRISGHYDRYINYWYQIGDTMDPGLKFNDDLKITIGDVDVTNQFDIVPADHSFTATADLKKLTGVTVSHNSVIIAEYTCTLTEAAVSGEEGNKNKVVVKYQNDPYATEDPTEPGVTPPDVTIVFTYDTIVNKIDNTGKALAGAGFTLYKWVNNDWKAVGSEITGVTTFNYNKLDKGIYKLVETTVPEGYNKADDIEFHIHPEYDTTQDPVELTALKVVDKNGDELTNFKIDMVKGSLTTDIVNNSGVELPSTGGMGTTLFYIFGGLMVAAAVVLLVTKKRMSADT